MPWGPPNSRGVSVWLPPGLHLVFKNAWPLAVNFMMIHWYLGLRVESSGLEEAPGLRAPVGGLGMPGKHAGAPRIRSGLGAADPGLQVIHLHGPSSCI